MKRFIPSLCYFILAGLPAVVGADAKSQAEGEQLFREKVAIILETNCIKCHNDKTAKGKFSLETFERAMKGGDTGEAIIPGEAAKSLLIEQISGAKPAMPAKSDPLKAEEIAVIRQWIQMGAAWPQGLVLKEKVKRTSTWWSHQPVAKVQVPVITGEDAKWVRTPIDAFIIKTLREKKLSPAPRADARTLQRRLYFDLTGLPPTPGDVDAFLKEWNEENSSEFRVPGSALKGKDAENSTPRNSPTRNSELGTRNFQAYEKLVDLLLASPQYGERWGRHWLDVVHYGDTHGYDKDQPRPSAWPYRDYVIRAFNEDRNFTRFVEEQIAGDVLYPSTTDGITALGFISAGPWDLIGHAEVPESKIDGKVARNLDRDDMVRNTIETFTSTTVGCARCHDHKFDPISMEDYYSLQAVFAALDRADKPYDASPQVAAKRAALIKEQAALKARKDAIDAVILKAAGPELVSLNQRIAALTDASRGGQRPEFGYHTQLADKQDMVKWVQVDLGKPQKLEKVILVACNDDFAGIGKGFGFPVRFKIEASNDAQFKEGVLTLADHSQADYKNPGIAPQSFEAGGKEGRFIRVTVSKLFLRSDLFMFSLAELVAISTGGENVALGMEVTSLDTIEAPVRWQRKNLTDGIHEGAGKNVDVREMASLTARRDEVMAKAAGESLRAELNAVSAKLGSIAKDLAALPAPGLVFAGTVHKGSGTFVGRGAMGGKPRDIHVLARGEVTMPGQLVQPGTLMLVPNAEYRFNLPADHVEGDRRAALAKWLTRNDHPLTWRSIVNRVWLYHMGRGIVDSANDFGRMGQLPTHPELLDWLATEFRDNGQSFKKLHKLIVMSSVYQQASAHSESNAGIDGSNEYYWRANRRRLEAEAIRDSVLLISGKLDTTMGGPGFWTFVMEKPEHSPHYQYHKMDPNDPKTMRRSVYRFIVRSAPDPLAETLDCADPSQQVEKRNETITALQALAMMNNPFMITMSGHFAARLKTISPDIGVQITQAYRLTIGRAPTAAEHAAMLAYANEFGMANACRVMFNLNEFVFVD